MIATEPKSMIDMGTIDDSINASAENSEEEEQRTEFLIPACNWPEFERRIEALNKRARRIKVAEIEVVKELDHVEYEAKQPQCMNAVVTGRCGPPQPASKTVWISEDNWEANQASPLPAEKTGRVREVYKVTVNGETPKYDGWSFIATLEPLVTDDGAENIIRAVPGHSCPPVYRDRVGQCDHCNTQRQRKQTFVVLHDDGRHKCVGRSCIKDFLGHASPHSLAAQAELMVELAGLCESAGDEDWLGGGGYQPSAWDLKQFLSWTASIIAKDGWRSKGHAWDYGGVATVSDVLFALCPPNPKPGGYDEWKDERRPTEKHEAEAVEAIEWAVGLSEEDKENDYLYNVNLLARAGYTNGKSTGLAASIMAAFSRARERELRLKRLAARPDSHHVGVLKRRAEFTVTVERIFSVDGHYGTTGIHRMSDEDGNDLVWFASGSAEWLDEGCTYRIKATPVKHDDYKGRPQTKVNRVTVVEEITELEEVVA